MSLIETLLRGVIKYKSEISGLESIRVHKIAAGYSIHTLFESYCLELFRQEPMTLHLLYTIIYNILYVYLCLNHSRFLK